MLPRNHVWLREEFQHEPWFDVIGYQGRYGDAPDHLRWLVMGPPASDLATEPVFSVIKLEPNFEGHVSYDRRTRFTDLHAAGRVLDVPGLPPGGWSYANNPAWV